MKSVNTFRSKTALLAFVTLLFGSGFTASEATAEESIAELLQVERKVQEVVADVMPAVVAVTDGLGFGSGVVVSKDGLVLTAGHVMASPYKDRYEVIFPNGQVKKAVPLGKNLDVDAGMVQIVDEGEYPYVDLATDATETGEWVITLGHSGGYDLGRKPPVRTGRILGHRKHQLISDAVLIGGDSGGPLFNLAGELIGIHSSIGDSIAENRHVTVDTFRQHWTRMAASEVWGNLPDLSSPKKKKRARARMGVVVDREAENALVKSVHQNSPASRAGIQAGDVIIRFDNNRIDNAQDLIDTIKSKSAGRGYNIEILRNNYYFNVHLVLEKF